jgi:RNA polymerase sigma-32 factor
MAFVGTDDLNHYLTEIRRFPILTAEREQDLARRWRETRDAEAARLLAGSHLRLVVKIARGYTGYGLPLADLISEGNVGLMKALEKFDPDRGFRLATYAMWWIRASIQEYILQSWSLVKTGTTAAQKRLFFNLRKLKNKMREIEGLTLSPKTTATIAEALAVPESEVIAMNSRLSSRDQSLNAVVDENGETEWLDLLVSGAPSPEFLAVEADELAWRRELLKQGLDDLNERERRILIERRLKEEPSTLEELSQEYHVSRERIRQIEVRAFEKLQQAVRRAAIALGRRSLATA